MAKKDKTNTLLIFGGLALAGGIAYYAWSSGLLGGTAVPDIAAVPEPAATAPTTIPGVTDYPTLTETLNAPAPIPTYTPPITTPVPTPEPEPEVPKCPTGWTGTYPACNPPPPIYQCPAGWTGTYPNCIPPAAPVTPTCPTGWTGVYPSCIPPAPVYKCPTNWTGTYPNCSPPVIVPPVVTPPPSTCVRNSSLCSSKYHGKCNTECRSPNSSACKGCRCACEGRSNLALAFAGSRYSDDGVQDRAYYVTAVGGY